MTDPMPLFSSRFDPLATWESLRALLHALHYDRSNRGILLLVAENSTWLQHPNPGSVWQNAFVGQTLPIAGAVFPALIFDGQLHDCGVIALGLKMPFNCQWFEKTDPVSLDANPPRIPPDTQTVFLFYEWHTPVDPLLEQLYHRRGMNLQYIGGGAGQWPKDAQGQLRDPKQPPPLCLFTQDQWRNQGALVTYCGVESSIGVAHGWLKLSKTPLIVTKLGAGHELIELNHQPAIKAYWQLLSEIDERLLHSEHRGIVGSLCFGIPSLSREETVVRTPMRIETRLDAQGQPEEFIVLAGSIPLGASLYLMIAHEDGLLQATDQALQAAQAAQKKHLHYSQALVFGCYDRAKILPPDKFQEEMRQVASRWHGYLGCLAIGEIGSNGLELPLQHNETMTVCFLADHTHLRLENLLTQLRLRLHPPHWPTILMLYLRELRVSMLGLYRWEKFQKGQTVWKALAWTPQDAQETPPYSLAWRQAEAALNFELSQQIQAALLAQGTAQHFYYYVLGLPNWGVMLLVSKTHLEEALLNELHLINTYLAQAAQKAKIDTPPPPKFHSGLKLKYMMELLHWNWRDVQAGSFRSLQRWWAEGVPEFRIKKLCAVWQIPPDLLLNDQLSQEEFQQWVENWKGQDYFKKEET